MTEFDKIYNKLVKDILENGYNSKEYGNVRTKYADGTPAHYKFLLGYNFRFKVDWNNPKTYPLITSRYVPVKSAIREIAWIWLFRSNNVDDLVNKLDCKFWNEWKMEDGTIGKAYGKNIDLPVYGYKNQLEYVVETLKTDPNSRRCITEIWIPEYLDKMALTPCVHHTQWSVVGDELILKVSQRSCDTALGILSNCSEYTILQKLIADELGLKMGETIWHIHNVHIYDRHIEDIKKQIESTKEVGDWKLVIPENFPSVLKDWDIHNDEDVELINGIYIEGYKASDFPKYNYEVAI